MATDHSEVALQALICSLLKSKFAEQIRVASPTDNRVTSLAHLLCGQEFDVTDEEKREKWNRFPDVGIDIVGGSRMAPDIILSSRNKRHQRILIEVKKHSSLTFSKDRGASQVARYFLYLLYTTLRHPEGEKKPAIRRAVLLAAPKKWFNGTHGQVWKESVKIYSPIARTFDITLGEIHEEDLPQRP